MEDLHCQEVLRESVVSPEPRTNQFGYSLPLVCQAYKDPVILEDSRVFQNMLDIEEFYIAATNYFQNIQSEILPHMRKIVTDWMLEVCLDQQCHADVFLLSCNIMDRFLSQLNIKKGQFQLVAAATLFIASKLVDPCPITGSSLVKYTDNTYQLTELLEMELLILSKLKWDLSAVTPYDFLEHLLKLLIEDGAILQSDLLQSELLKNTGEVISLCATEFRFSMYPPSMLSSAALAAAIQGLAQRDDHEFDISDLITRLQILTRVENDCLTDCIHQIEETFREATENVNNHMQQMGQNSTNTLPNNTNNSSKVINNNQIDSKTTSTAKENTIFTDSSSSSSAELKSRTPTEVFNVDLVYIT